MEKVKMNIIMKQLNLRLNDNKTFCIAGIKKNVKGLAVSQGNNSCNRWKIQERQ